MGLEQKFIEEGTIEIDEQFLESLTGQFPIEVQEDILTATSVALLHSIPQTNPSDFVTGFKEVVQYYGVISHNGPIFFRFDITKVPEELPELLDIREVETDLYLDAYNEGKAI
jgi:hypothetical protein